jgi:hypothetical protein
MGGEASMTLQTLKIGGREFVLVARRDFEKLADQARQYAEDKYWTKLALETEAKSRAKKEKPIPFEEVEKELKMKNGASPRSPRRKR